LVPNKIVIQTIVDSELDRHEVNRDSAPKNFKARISDRAWKNPQPSLSGTQSSSMPGPGRFFLSDWSEKDFFRA
jgi:hypothetical protein